MAFTRSGVRSPSAPLQQKGKRLFPFSLPGNLSAAASVVAGENQTRFKMTHQRILFQILSGLLVTSFFIAGCKKDDGIVGPDGSPSDVIFPPSNVSYSQHVQRLFNQTCALVGCHSSQEGPDALKLDNHYNAVFQGVRGGRVIYPGSPETSPLVFRIEGRLPPRMPPNTTNPLNQNQINGIRTWIAEGALNN